MSVSVEVGTAVSVGILVAVLLMRVRVLVVVLALSAVAVRFLGSAPGSTGPLVGRLERANWTTSRISATRNMMTPRATSS